MRHFVQPVATRAHNTSISKPPNGASRVRPLSTTSTNRASLDISKTIQENNSTVPAGKQPMGPRISISRSSRPTLPKPAVRKSTLRSSAASKNELISSCSSLESCVSASSSTSHKTSLDSIKKKNDSSSRLASQSLANRSTALLSRMNLTPFKRDINELVEEFVENDLTTFADMKRVWLSRKFSYIYQVIPSTNLAFYIQSLYAHTIGHMVSINSFSRRLGGLYCLYCLHEVSPFKPKFRIYISSEELRKFRDLIFEARNKGVEIAVVVAKQMMDKNMFIFGVVDFSETSTTKEFNQLAELQNARVQIAFNTLISDTEIEQFVHMDMGNEVDLSSLHKLSTKYAEAKKRAVKCAGEMVEVDDIKHIAEEKELVGERVEKLHEERDLQKQSFYEHTNLNSFTTTTQKLLKGNDNEEDDGFDELDRLLSQS